jgi:hypothetical protein
MLSLVLLAALAPEGPEPAPIGGAPPEQMLARLADGKLTITHVGTACYGQVGVENTVAAQETKGTEKVTVQAKVKVTTLMVTTAELPAKYVEAYTADGRPIAPERLATLLAKERAVLVSLDGKKVDPFLLQLYKDDTIVLVPPVNAVPLGNGGYPAGPLAMPVPAPLPPEIRKPLPDREREPERKP